MDPHRTRATIALLCCIAAACSSPTSSLDERALDQAQARWASRGFDSYSYETHTSCGECPADVARPTRVQVRDGRVSAAIVVANDSLLPSVASCRTIDEVFAQLREYKRDTHSREVRVQYHPYLGYPTSIDVFAKAGIMDGDYGIDIGKLVPAP